MPEEGETEPSMADASVKQSAQDVVRIRYPDLNPDDGPGATRRWKRLVRLTEVIQEYESAQAAGEKFPAKAIAQARGVEPGTVRMWLHQARKEGFDVPRKTRVASAGDVVRRNVRLLREARRMSTVRLSEVLEAHGRPIPATGITRLENGDRRVDVDDLVALADVFGVAPAALLETLSCEGCHGAPPPGFACNACGAGASTPESLSEA